MWEIKFIAAEGYAGFVNDILELTRYTERYV